MIRLIGSPKSEAKKAVDSAKREDNGHSLRLGFVLLSLSRFVFLVLTFCFGCVVLVKLHSSETEANSQCPLSDRLSLSSSSNSSSHQEHVVHIKHGTSLVCHTATVAAIVSVVFSFFLFSLALFNIFKRRFSPAYGCLPQMQLLFTTLVALLTVAFAGVVTVSVSEFSSEGVDSWLSSVPCPQCPGYASALKEMNTLRLFFWACCCGWVFVVLLSTVQLHQGKKRLHDLEEAQAIVEQEEAEKKEKKKLQADLAKQEGQGQGKGFVYRLLM